MPSCKSLRDGIYIYTHIHNIYRCSDLWKIVNTVPEASLARCSGVSQAPGAFQAEGRSQGLLCGGKESGASEH